MTTTFDNGLYAITRGAIWWYVSVKRSDVTYEIISPNLKSKPAAVQWLWDALQEEHDLSRDQDEGYFGSY